MKINKISKGKNESGNFQVKNEEATNVKAQFDDFKRIEKPTGERLPSGQLYDRDTNFGQPNIFSSQKNDTQIYTSVQNQNIANGISNEGTVKFSNFTEQNFGQTPTENIQIGRYSNDGNTYKPQNENMYGFQNSNTYGHQPIQQKMASVTAQDSYAMPEGTINLGKSTKQEGNYNNTYGNQSNQDHSRAQVNSYTIKRFEDSSNIVQQESYELGQSQIEQINRITNSSYEANKAAAEIEDQLKYKQQQENVRLNEENSSYANQPEYYVGRSNKWQSDGYIKDGIIRLATGDSAAGNTLSMMNRIKHDPATQLLKASAYKAAAAGLASQKLNQSIKYINDDSEFKTFLINKNDPKREKIGDIQKGINDACDDLRLSGVKNPEALDINGIKYILRTDKALTGPQKAAFNRLLSKRTEETNLLMKTDVNKIKDPVKRYNMYMSSVQEFLNAKNIHINVRNMNVKQIKKILDTGMIGVYAIKKGDGIEEALRTALKLDGKVNEYNNLAKFSPGRAGLSIVKRSVDHTTANTIQGFETGYSVVHGVAKIGKNLKKGKIGIRTTNFKGKVVGANKVTTAKTATKAAVKNVAKDKTKTALLKHAAKSIAAKKGAAVAAGAAVSASAAGTTGAAVATGGWPVTLVLLVIALLVGVVTMFVDENTMAQMNDLPASSYSENLTTEAMYSSPLQQSLHYASFLQSSAQKNLRSFDPDSESSGVGLMGINKTFFDNPDDPQIKERLATAKSHGWFLIDWNSFIKENVARTVKTEEFLNPIMREESKTAYYNKEENSTGRKTTVEYGWVKGVTNIGKVAFEDDKSIIGYDLERYWGPKIFPYSAEIRVRPQITYDEDGNITDIVKGKVGTCTLYGTAGLKGDASKNESIIYLNGWKEIGSDDFYVHYAPIYNTSYSGKGGHGCKGKNEYVLEDTDAYDNREPTDKYREWNSQGEAYVTYSGCQTTELNVNNIHNYYNGGGGDDGSTGLTARTYNNYVNGTTLKYRSYKIGRENNDRVFEDSPGTDTVSNLNRNDINDTYRYSEGMGGGAKEPYDARTLYKNITAAYTALGENTDECVAFQRNWYSKTYELIASRATNNLQTYYEEGFDPYGTGGNFGENCSTKIYRENENDDYIYFWVTPFPDHPQAVDTHEPLRGETNYTFKAIGFLTTQYWDCGIQDIFRLDNTTNEWCHNMDNHNYNQNDENCYKVYAEEICNGSSSVPHGAGGTNPYAPPYVYDDPPTPPDSPEDNPRHYENDSEWVAYADEADANPINADDVDLNMDMGLTDLDLGDLSDNELYNKLTTTGGFTEAKATAMVAAYTALKSQEYSDKFAIAIMANISHEGILGGKQGGGNLTTLNSILAFKNKSGAFGMCQWDEGRKSSLIDAYARYAQENGITEFTTAQMAQIECSFMISELSGSERGARNKIQEKENAGASVYELGEAVQKWYERPGKRTDRGAEADKIASTLML